MARASITHSAEAATVLLNWHYNRLLDVSVYTYKLVVLRALVRGVSSCSGQRLLQRLVTDLNVEHKRLLEGQP